MKKNILIIPDVHCHPDYDSRRLEYIYPLTQDYGIDTLIQLGDFADMPSLCSYDKGTRSFEGRRYKKDVDSCLKGLDDLFTTFGHASDIPERYIVLGNHEARIDKATQLSPELHDTISIADLRFQDYFQKVVPFKEELVYQGIVFSHYFASGIMGRPIGGRYAAQRMTDSKFMPAVAGHSHELKVSVERKGNKFVTGIVAGCYINPRYNSDWCRNTRHLWWNGVTILTGVQRGEWDHMEFITQKRLKETYGRGSKPTRQ